MVSFRVNFVSFCDIFVVFCQLAGVNVQSNILMCSSKSEFIFAYGVGSSKVVNHSICTADASVTDTWDYPRDAGQRRPGDTQRESSLFRIHLGDL